MQVKYPFFIGASLLPTIEVTPGVLLTVKDTGLTEGPLARPVWQFRVWQAGLPSIKYNRVVPPGMSPVEGVDDFLALVAALVDMRAVELAEEGWALTSPWFLRWLCQTGPGQTDTLDEIERVRCYLSDKDGVICTGLIDAPKGV